MSAPPERLRGETDPRQRGRGGTVKYVWFGYLDVDAWASKTGNEQEAMIDACLAYDEQLKRDGHWVTGEGLQGPQSASTLRHRNGRISVTDGPYVETKEFLGGLLIL